MGVGAVFVSTLALSRLPTPQNPPQTQLDLLALTLQVIVAFVVLGSIFIRMLLTPFDTNFVTDNSSRHVRRSLHPILQRQP